MRELKFRVYKKDPLLGNGRFLENGSGTHCFSQFVLDIFSGKIYDAIGEYYDDENDFRSLAEQGDCIIQQFTGLLDKNEKEIYEGDIVKYTLWENEYDICENELIADVSFIKGAFYPRYINDICDDGWYSWGIDKIEVIGNIFENPELLKRG